MLHKFLKLFLLLLFNYKVEYNKIVLKIKKNRSSASEELARYAAILAVALRTVVFYL